jgi:hypothetical protein
MPRRIELPCSVCGARAAALEIGFLVPSLAAGEEVLVYDGLVKGRQTFPLDLAREVLACLEAGDVAGAHTAIPGGLDSFCPECGKLFCATCYRVEMVDDEDEDWYDASYGTCPAGHRRMLDD